MNKKLLILLAVILIAGCSNKYIIVNRITPEVAKQILGHDCIDNIERIKVDNGYMLRIWYHDTDECRERIKEIPDSLL